VQHQVSQEAFGQGSAIATELGQDIRQQQGATR